MWCCHWFIVQCGEAFIVPIAWSFKVGNRFYCKMAQYSQNSMSTKALSFLRCTLSKGTESNRAPLKSVLTGRTIRLFGKQKMHSLRTSPMLGVDV